MKTKFFFLSKTKNWKKKNLHEQYKIIKSECYDNWQPW